MASNDPYLLQPLTLLDAVNAVLRNIGSGSVQTLDDISLNSDGEDALKAIHDWSIQVQQSGWQWNTDDALTLDPVPQDNPTIPGRIQLPSNTLRVDTVGKDAPKDLVQRGLYLYDKQNHTFNIGASVLVDLVTALDFEELPQVARNYITIKAGRQIAAQKVNSPTTNQWTNEDAVEAYVALLHAEDESDDRTLYDRNRRMLVRARHRRMP